MTVLESAKERIESMSWVKRIVLGMTVMFVIGLIVAFVFAPSSAEREPVDAVETVESANFMAVAFLAFIRVAPISEAVLGSTLLMYPSRRSETGRSRIKQVPFSLVDSQLTVPP